ncbi:MAG TPA: RNA-binding cell elongation regulator Jag/EloR [Anaerolineales bacterium]|nr:RNA-binding cell elongation regulator Jag/EloR [Anaerolineales bacterium]
MNERTTLEIIAPTVEEAIAQGLAQLGLTADAVSVEVLDAGFKGLFGLGKPQVRVRLTVNPSGGVSALQRESAIPESEAVESPPSSPLAQTHDKPAPVMESESAPFHDELLDKAEAVVSKLLHLLNLEAQVSAAENVREDRRTILVDVRGNDLSVLIGRRSETLNAFQYIASLILGKETEQFVQLIVDVEGYRERREKQLIQMAKRVADQVIKTGRRQALEPMPPAERRIVHLALRDHPQVKTESIGEEPYRKVTILPKDG